MVVSIRLACRLYKRGIVLMLLAFVSGCATYQQTANVQLARFNQGHSDSAIAYFTTRQHGINKQLYLAEAGRLKMLEGDFAGSHGLFERVIDVIFDVREGAMIRLQDVGGGALAATFLDDRSRPYNLPAFESVLVFQYQSLNALFMGNPEAAAVEARRAVAAQDLVLERYEREVERARELAVQEGSDGVVDTLDDYFVRIGPVLGRAKSGFQNPFVWYYSGLMYELQGEPDNAYIAYKKAWELSPDNAWVQRDLLRLAERQNPQEWGAFKEQFDLGARVRLRGATGEIIIFYEEGLISQRHSVVFPVLLGSTFHNISYPVYQDGPYQPMQIRATLRPGSEIGDLMPLAYLQSLAYHDLKMRLPAIQVRNISRAVSREVARSIGRNSDDALLDFILSLWAMVSFVSERADTRGWYSLPMGVQMLRSYVAAGDHTLVLQRDGGGDKLEIPLQLLPGEQKLVWVADLGLRRSWAVASLTHAGLAATHVD
ncbi:MAG: hypothetical protein ACNA71_08995 [Kiritimatiellia bacterium]